MKPYRYIEFIILLVLLGYSGAIQAQDNENNPAQAAQQAQLEAAQAARKQQIETEGSASNENSATDSGQTAAGQDDKTQLTSGEQTGEVPVDPLSLITVVPGGPPVRIPIAVPAAKLTQGDDVYGVGSILVDVIRNDFEMSGLLHVMPVSTYGIVDMSKDGFSASNISFDSWYHVGASALVKIIYSPNDDQSFLVDFKLFDIDAGMETSLRFAQKRVTKNNARAVAHDFVNAVIGFYTGTPGVFGSRILFARGGKNNHRQIGSFETDGWGVSAFPLPEGLNVMPAWGPGGGILYSHLSDQGDDLYLYSNKENKRIAKLEGWSGRASYCRSKKLIAFTGSDGEHSNIYIMKADGSEVKKLTDMGTSLQVSPSWAPGCKRLAFVSDLSGKPQIYVINADGSGMRRMTWVGRYNTTPAWSPKGDLIAFTARDERNVFDIFTINAATGELTRLTQDQGHNKEPSWSPDGRYLVFESTRDGRASRLYLMSADGRWQTRLSAIAGLYTPAWY